MASASFSVCSLNARYHKSPLFWQAYTWQHLSDILEEITINGEKRSLESLKGVGMKYPEGRCWEFFAHFYPIFYLLLFWLGVGKCHTQTSTLSRRVGLTSRWLSRGATCQNQASQSLSQILFVVHGEGTSSLSGDLSIFIQPSMAKEVTQREKANMLIWFTLHWHRVRFSFTWSPQFSHVKLWNNELKHYFLVETQSLWIWANNGKMRTQLTFTT